MTHFVLIHGSFHGPWCWERLAPALTAAGHRVSLPDLQRSGNRLDDYVGEIGAAIQTARSKTVLVGHSMGGIVASQAAEMYGDRIAGTVYVSGLLLRAGESLLDFIAAHADLGVEDLVLKNMVMSADGAVATFPAKQAHGIFYNLCSEADAGWASARLRPQPVAVYAARLSLTDARYGRVPRYYVATTEDQAVSPLYQRAMTERTACTEVFWLEADHSPFLSLTADLVDLLLRIDTALLAEPAA